MVSARTTATVLAGGLEAEHVPVRADANERGRCLERQRTASEEARRDADGSS